MANYRTRMQRIGCPKMTLNALINTCSDKCLPAKDVKKPRKAVVNYFPANAAGSSFLQMKV